MKKYQRIIVALDHTVFDEKLIRYISKFCALNRIKKIHFLYVDKDLETPPGIDLVSKDELITKTLKAEIDANFSNPQGAEITVDVLEGNPLKEILHWIKVKEADLLVVGNKKLSEGSGVMAKRIARHASCDVLFVPETSHETIRKILVPVDFSEYSKLAMEGAIDLATALDQATITCLNTFDIPMTGFSGITMSYDRFARDMTAFKQEALHNYIESFDLKEITTDTAQVINENGSPARQIYAFAVKGSYDLVVIGAKGHSTLQRVLMGSTTEKLLGLDKEIPVLVLRKG